MIESGSTITLGKYKVLFDEIHNLDEDVIMDTNGGQKNIDQECEWTGYGQVYFVPDAMMNIVSVSDVISKGFQIYFDSKKDNAFYVTNELDRMVRFPYNEAGLYIQECTSSYYNTIEGYTPRQEARAKRAKKLYHNSHAETVPNLKNWVRSNMGRNGPVSHEDINLMVEMMGKDVSTFQGKSVRPKASVVDKCKIMEIPIELEMKGTKCELAIDVVYINDQSFLHSVNRRVKFQGLSHLGTQKKGENYAKKILFKGLDNIPHFYNKHEVYMSWIHADNEFWAFFNTLEDN